MLVKDGAGRHCSKNDSQVIAVRKREGSASRRCRSGLFHELFRHRIKGKSLRYRCVQMYRSVGMFIYPHGLVRIPQNHQRLKPPRPSFSSAVAASSVLPPSVGTLKQACGMGTRRRRCGRRAAGGDLAGLRQLPPPPWGSCARLRARPPWPSAALRSRRRTPAAPRPARPASGRTLPARASDILIFLQFHRSRRASRSLHPVRQLAGGRSACQLPVSARFNSRISSIDWRRSLFRPDTLDCNFFRPAIP